MKLSQKLLALGGVTLADYACCPYDDYGMPHDLCTNALPEKTPFSLEADWRDGACKAWESNVDATYDGNDNGCANGSNTNENWGSCGFQRHFPWNAVDTEPFKNRGCTVTKDAEGVLADAFDGGCNCSGLGDAQNVSGEVACKTIHVIAGTSTPTTSACITYNAVTHAATDPADFAAGDICCDPNADAGDLDAATSSVDISCFTACDADHLAAMNTKDTCYTTDFLGRRNIQSKSLYIDMQVDTATSPAYAGTGSIAELGFSYDADATASTGGDSNALKYNLAGVPFLGGVCKLFVPVPMSRIVSVQIAGVHVSLEKQSVFPAKVDAASTPAYTTGEDVGTAYCFSVVNPAEGMNNSGNNIHNGNVAGESNGNAIFAPLQPSGTSLQQQAGAEPLINFFDGTDAGNIGDVLEDTVGEANGDSEVGANFDVVVHIHSEWCNSFWTPADMQLAGDYNNGVTDYPLNNFPANAVATPSSPYSAAQTGDLAIVALYTAQTTATTNEANAQDTFDNIDFGATTCGTALAGNCDTEVGAYMTATQNLAYCTQMGTCTNQADTLSTAATDFGTCITGESASADCADGDTNDIVDDIQAYYDAADDLGTKIAVSDQADDAVTNNGFTHAHMDLMDKRNNNVASWNNVYEQSGDYLQFPSSADDAFVQVGSVGNTYTAAASYLRWPNAGAFAAFYSFVACANPPHITTPADSADGQTNTASIIYSKSTIVQTAPASEGEAYSHYGAEVLTPRTLVMSASDSDYRDENCDNRTFRGNLRQVGNTVTVCGPGQLPDTDSKRCTWNWNYNAHAYSTGGWNEPKTQENDPEEWFDRNNPHNFDMWSTRKRRTATANDRKYAFNMGYWGTQEGETGTGSKMFNGVAFDSETPDHAAAIQIPITNFDFNLKFKTADNQDVPSDAKVNTAACFAVGSACECRPHFTELNNPANEFQLLNGDAIVFVEDIVNNFPAAFVDGAVHHATCTGAANPNGKNLCSTAEFDEITDSLNNLAQECDAFQPADANGFVVGGYYQASQVQSLTFDDSRVEAFLNPTNMKWEVSVRCPQSNAQVNLAAMPSNEAQRDHFPDCFFGDELHFTFNYGSGSTNGYNLSYNSYASAWFSTAELATYDVNGVETSELVQTYNPY